MKEITKLEAESALLEGKRVKNVYYSDEEYVFLNEDDYLQTEDGYIHGSFSDEFWSIIQEKLPNRWYVVEQKIKYDTPIQVTGNQYHSLRKSFGGLIAFREDSKGNYWIKVWRMSHSEEILKQL